MSKRLNIDELSVGDFVVIQFADGFGRITGTVKELMPSHRQVKLHTGWCGHDGDLLLEHKKETTPNDSRSNA